MVRSLGLVTACLFVIFLLFLIFGFFFWFPVETHRSIECSRIISGLDRTRNLQRESLNEWWKQRKNDDQKSWSFTSIQENLLVNFVSNNTTDLLVNFQSLTSAAECQIYTLGTKKESSWFEYSECNFISLNSTSFVNGHWTQIDDRKEQINILLVDIEGLELDQYASLIQLERQLLPLCQIDIRIRNPPHVNGQPVNVIDVLAGFLTTDSYSVLAVEQQPDSIHFFLFNSANSECIQEFICQ